MQKKACERYQNLSKEVKEKSDNMVVNNNLLENEKQKLEEYRKKYNRMRKNVLM